MVYKFPKFVKIHSLESLSVSRILAGWFLKSGSPDSAPLVKAFLLMRFSPPPRVRMTAQGSTTLKCSSSIVISPLWEEIGVRRGQPYLAAICPSSLAINSVRRSSESRISRISCNCLESSSYSCSNVMTSSLVRRARRKSRIACACTPVIFNARIRLVRAVLALSEERTMAITWSISRTALIKPSSLCAFSSAASLS